LGCIYDINLYSNTKYDMSHYHDLITGLPETEEASESFVETDPVFEAWLLATPPLYSEVDPAFSAWLLATPPAYPADIPDITGLVPYTGATGNVDLGANFITTSSVYFPASISAIIDCTTAVGANATIIYMSGGDTDTGNGGNVEISGGSTTDVGGVGGNVKIVGGNGGLVDLQGTEIRIVTNGGFYGHLKADLLTSHDGVFQFPNKAGEKIIATTEDITGTNSGTNTGDQFGDGVSITGTGTLLDPFVSASGGGDMFLASAQTVTGAKTFDNGTLLLRNVADTFNGSFTNTNTADHIYTLKDSDGTIAFTSDIIAETDPVFGAWLIATPPAYASDLALYVPYTGATGDVDLGIHKITTEELNFNKFDGQSGWIRVLPATSGTQSGGSIAIAAGNTNYASGGSVDIRGGNSSDALTGNGGSVSIGGGYASGARPSGNISIEAPLGGFFRLAANGNFIKLSTALLTTSDVNVVDFPDKAGTLAMTDDITTALMPFVPYTGATADVNIGEFSLHTSRDITLGDPITNGGGTIKIIDGDIAIPTQGTFTIIGSKGFDTADGAPVSIYGGFGGDNGGKGGNLNLSAGNAIGGDSNGGLLALTSGAATGTGTPGDLLIGSNPSGTLVSLRTNGLTGITKIVTFPNKDGTIAYIDDIPFVPTVLDDLTDVVIATPAVDQVLRYNGAEWVNGVPSLVSAGSGVTFFYSDSASGVSTYETISIVPDAGAEADESIVVNAETLDFEQYSTTAALGRTLLDAGIWEFNIYTYATPSTGTSTLLFDVYQRAADTTETLLFTVETPDIDNSSVGLITLTSVQPSFVIDATDIIVVKVRARTTSVVDVTLHFVHSGTTHYSNIHTPFITLHNDLAGKQGGTASEYYHLTSAQYTALGTFITLADIPAETDPVFGAWLIATPPLFSEIDPVFSAWLLATPPLYSFTETDPIFVAWDKSTGISITVSQISDFPVTIGDTVAPASNTDLYIPQWSGANSKTLSDGINPATLQTIDANGNISTNNILVGYATQATAAGTTTLTVSSKKNQVFTGTLAESCVLPDATTLTVGQEFYIDNDSTGVVTIKTNGGATLYALQTLHDCSVVVSDISTSAGVWDINAFAKLDRANTMAGTLDMGANSITMSGSIAVTGTRVTKVWATDTESTNPPTVGGVVYAPTHRNGITTRDVTTASGAVNVAHGLGRTPKKVKVTAMLISSAGVSQFATGCYDGTNHSGLNICYSEGTSTAVTDQIFSSTAYELGFSAATIVNPYTGVNRQDAVITVDGTNIIFTWTKAGTVASATANIMWEVE
jgi:hypothetical protein